MRLTLKAAAIAAPLLLTLVLASCTPPGGGGPPLPAAQCYDNVFDDVLWEDFLFSGSLGVGNITVYGSHNGTCSSVLLGHDTAVWASSISEADTNCQALGQGNHHLELNADLGARGWVGLEGLWLCQVVGP
ncbi:MAG TPA: hypothetical protein VJM33_04135 [Microthrixaceae bacterium]|nr:hypothetical protein [Microthrixaceae bacterium]